MVSRRLIARHRVDLPEPEGPITTTTSPRLIARLMSCSTCRSPNHLFTWSRTTRPLRGAVPCEEAEDEAAVLMPGKLVMGRRIAYSRCPRRGCGSVTWYDDASNWSRRSSTTRAADLDHPGHGARPPRLRTSTTRPVSDHPGRADLDHPPGGEGRIRTSLGSSRSRSTGHREPLLGAWCGRKRIPAPGRTARGHHRKDVTWLARNRSA